MNELAMAVHSLVTGKPLVADNSLPTGEQEAIAQAGLILERLRRPVVGTYDSVQPQGDWFKSSVAREANTILVSAFR